MINVLIVEDSPVMQQCLDQILSSDPAIRVVGIARHGEEALDVLQLCNPDVITMDVDMPKMDGLEATRRIMETYPVPIVIVSAVRHPHEVEKTFQAIQAGAVAVVEKPASLRRANHAAMAAKLTQTVKLVAEVKVEARGRERAPAGCNSPSVGDALPAPVSEATGGPPAPPSVRERRRA